MTRKRSTKTLDAIVDGTWTSFNEAFRHEVFSIDELEYMLDRELASSKRKQVAIALHQRLATQRSMQERNEIFKLCGGMMT